MGQRKQSQCKQAKSDAIFRVFAFRPEAKRRDTAEPAPSPRPCIDWPRSGPSIAPRWTRALDRLALGGQL